MDIRTRVRKILGLLNKARGRPHALRRSDSVDELVRTILSQNTNDRNSLAAFAVLKKRFRTWEGLLRTDTRRIAGLIKHAGLANIKAKRIKEVLGEIKRREGRISLAALQGLDVGEGLTYLRSLKGVGPKTAACVLLFSFGKPIMPVDTHIFRVSKRLGLIGPKLSIEGAHQVLSAIVPKHLTLRQSSGSSHRRKDRDLIYEFHLGIIEHGRRTCKAQNPRCGFCVLYNGCRFRDKRLYKRKSN